MSNYTPETFWMIEQFMDKQLTRKFGKPSYAIEFFDAIRLVENMASNENHKIVWTQSNLTNWVGRVHSWNSDEGRINNEIVWSVRISYQKFIQQSKPRIKA